MVFMEIEVVDKLEENPSPPHDEFVDQRRLGSAAHQPERLEKGGRHR
jgi:hypothetical protein